MECLVSLLMETPGKILQMGRAHNLRQLDGGWWILKNKSRWIVWIYSGEVIVVKQDQVSFPSTLAMTTILTQGIAMKRV